MAEIDSLEIKIQSEAKGASKALDGLIKKLDSIAGAMSKGLKSKGMSDFSAQAKGVSDGMELIKKSMNGMSFSAAPQIQKMAKAMSKLSAVGANGSAVTSSLPEIGNSVRKMAENMSGVGNIDSSVNKLVSSIARIASAGEKSTVAAKELPGVGDALKNIAEGMKGLDGISDSTNTFAQTVAQLANSGDKAGKAASGLEELSQRTLDFFDAMKNAPEVSENTIRMTQALAQLSAAGGRASSVSAKITTSMKPVNSAFATVSKMAEKMARVVKNALKGLGSIVGGTFSKIGQIGLKSSNAMKKVAGDMVAAFSRITHSSKGLKSVSSNFGTLLKTIIGFKGIQGILNFGKSALEFGSDITEVENVVDTAFGSMRQHAYDFASTAKEQFGLSELAAKQYSGTMMAMLKSSGVLPRQAAEMSTALAGLAGDLASFYNIETDEAFYKLRSAISGETEPMKQLGVNMNIVNLEAFALSRGINKAYKDMTLAEQATLRYNYILAKTTDAQGDFAKTADTYANQVRLLKLNFESLSGVIGQGLIAGILPAIKALNALMGKLMEAAKAFRTFMYSLMGKKIESTTSGIVNDLAGIGDASGSLGDLGDAAEEAGDKMKKKLFTLPFDELNILSEESKSLDDALGGIGDIDMGGLDDYFDTDSETPVNEWAKRLRDAFLAEDWEELGKTIAEMVNAGLQKVYDAIIDITPKVERALKDFAAVFNSFADWLDWDLLGRTIGAGVNMITTSINALFGDGGIDFENLGAKLASGLRGMIDEIDWTGLGNAIGNWFMVSWRIADGFIDGMWQVSAETMKNGWEELGIAVGEAVNSVFDRIDFEQIARVLAEGFRGILEAAANALDTIKFDVIAERINAGLETLKNGLAWEHIGEQVTNFSAAISKAFNDLLGLDFGLVGETIGNGVTTIIRAFNGLTGESGINFEQLGANISDGLRNLFSSIPWEEFGNALGNGFMVGWMILDGFVADMSQQDGAGITGWEQLGISIGNAINGIFQKIDFAAIGTFLSGAFNGLVDIIRNFVETIDWDGIGDNLTQGLNNFIHGVDWAGAGATLSDFVMNLLGVFWQVAQETDWEGFGRGIGEFLSNIDWWGIIGELFDIIWEVFSGCISGLFDTKAGKVILGFTGGLLAIKGIFKTVDVVTDATKWVNDIARTFGLLPEGANSVVPVVINKLKEIGTGLIEKVAPLVSTGVAKIAGEGGLLSKIAVGASGLVSKIGPILGSIGSVIFSPTGLLIAGIAAGVILIIANWDKIKEAASNLKDWVAEKWEGIKEKTAEIWGNIQDFLGKTWDGIKKWASEKFKNIRETISGAWNGIKENAQELWGNIKNFLGETWDGLKTWASEKFTNIKNAVVNAWGDLKKKTSDAWGNIKTFLGNTWDNLKDSVSEKFENIKTKISDTWEDAKQKTSETWENVKKTVGDKLSETARDASEKFSKLQGQMGEHGKNVISGLKQGIESVMGSLRSKVQEVAGNVTDWFKEKLGIHSPSTVFRDLGEYSLEGYSEGLKGASDVVNSQMTSIVENSLKPFDGLGEQFNGIGVSMVSELDSGVNEQVSTVKAMMGEMADLLKQAFASVADMTKDVFGKIDSSSIAKNLMEGIANGISGNTSSVLGKIGSVAESMVKKFKSSLGIHSPSKVFYELAGYTMEGFNEGIDASQAGLQNKLSDVASSIGQTFSRGFAENASIALPPPNSYEYSIPANITTSALINDGQIMSGIEEAAYRGFARANADNSREEELLEELIRAVREGKHIYIGDRDIVDAYDRGKARQGYSFSN